MDVGEMWGWRVHSGNHLSSSSTSSMQASKFYPEGEDDIWDCFPCPFCYLDVELPILCTHLQEEHCFDITNAVCPVCAANVGMDMIGHLTVQHSHLLKKRKSQKTSLSNSSSANVEKEPHDFCSYLGAASNNRRGNACDSSPDPLLSSFIFCLSSPHAKGEQEVNCDPAASVAAMSSHVQSVEQYISNQVLEEKDYVERSERAEFVQQLLISTFF